MIEKMITIALVTAALQGRSQSSPYTLTLRLTTSKAPAKAYLLTSFGWSDQRVIDSAVVNDGAVQFKGTVEGPMKAQLLVDHNEEGLKSLGVKAKSADVLVVYLEPGTILVTGKGTVKDATVSGSALNTAYVKYYEAVLAPGDRVSQELDTAFAAAPEEKRKDPTFMTGIMATLKRVTSERDSLKNVYIRENPGSYFSLEALRELAGKDIDTAKIIPVFNTLSPELRDSKAGKAFAEKLYDLGPTSIGSIAPDFTQPDANDQPVKLSGLRGKYVLLDFWASWCGPCRAENPHVVKAYAKYKDRNFTVLGVSLDQPGKKDAWLAAIKKDGLTWTQVSDLQFWNNAAAKQYGITAIPQNFLIDPKGKIVAKNLRGDALEKKLEEIL